MPINFYYIDDDPKMQIDEIAKGLSIETNYLNVKAHQPKKWEEIINFIIEEQVNFDGLLLDWGLTKKNENGDDANFTVEALAQQIRRLIIDGSKLKKDFPIVLCSAQFNFKKIYGKELSSHDLFDIVYEKDTFSDQNERVIRELAELAEGYKFLTEIINIHNEEVLKIFKVEKNIIDYRIYDYLSEYIKSKKPIHEIARFILTKIVLVNGQLIDENTLSARLGFDLKAQNPKTMTKLFSILNPFTYNGVFGNGWKRWWMPLVDNWWQITFDGTLSDINADERIQKLNDKFDLNLKVADLQKYNKSKFFWAACKETGLPVAIDDAVLATSAIDKVPWEDDEYYSFDRALEKDLSDIHPLERERIENFKKSQKTTRTRLI